jgi:hypothetical protein
MTLEELETKLDEVLAESDIDIRSTKIADLKLAMRDYKSERDETELQKDSEIESLKEDVKARDETINTLKESNSALAQRYGKIALENRELDDRDDEEENEIDDLIRKF